MSVTCHPRLAVQENVLTSPSISRIQEISIKLPDKEPKVEENEVPDELAVETFNPYGAAHLLLDIPLHGMYQAQNLCRAESVPRLIHTPSPYSEASNFEIPLVDGYESQPGSDDEEDMSHVSARSPYFPYPEDCQTSLFGIMTSYVGTSPVESLHSLPVEATRRNAELMHMCECIYLSPLPYTKMLNVTSR